MTDHRLPPEPHDPTPAASRVYVLRVWYEGPAVAPVWRATVRTGHLGERTYFASLDACLEHLYGELARR